MKMTTRQNLGETDWLDALTNIGSKYLDYRTTVATTKAAVAVAPYSQPQATNYRVSTAPAIPQQLQDNTMLYVGLGGVALIAIMLLGGKK